MEYTPLNLAPWSNQEAQPPAEDGSPFAGPQTLRGLPFAIHPVHFCGSESRPLQIPIQARARWLLFAHRLDDPSIHEGKIPGDVVAHYCFAWNDGISETIPIRERFEIGFVPPRFEMRFWGQAPFAAVSDRCDWMMPRDAGPWDQTGFRQTEANGAFPARFYLWAWPNPRPDEPLAWVEIQPHKGGFLLGGITLCHLAENPLAWEPLRPVRLTLANPEVADRPFDLAVEVDRGVSTYTYPLPRAAAETFTADPMAGWGQEYSNHNSPAYVQIAASPSATLRVRSGKNEIAALRWGDVLAHGAAATETARIELVENGKNWVHVTVVDDESGQPIPCRVHFRSPQGVPWQPHGHHSHLLSDKGTWHIDVGGDLRLGHVTYAYIDGHCQGWLPQGELLVDVARGFEYAPLRAPVHIAPGQRELTLRLKRWSNLSAEGWYSGDTHVHFLSTQGAHLEAQGEDLNVVNLLLSQWGHLFTNSEEFLGRPVPSPDGRTIVYAGQENRQHLLGHLSLLGLKSPVMPWCSDGPDEAELGGGLETTLCHWADACHAQGGTVVIPHMPVPNGEPAALIATGRTDGIEMLIGFPWFHREYYRYLNGGYRLPLVGGTDKMSSDVPVGLYRTWARLLPDEEFTYDAWCASLRAGRTFISSGPILRFSVEGAAVGETVMLPGNGGTVEVQAEARSIFPMHCLQIVQEGRIVAAVEDPQGSTHLHLTARLRLDHHTWLAARVSGPGYDQQLPHHDEMRRGIMAHTSPIYVAVGEAWWMRNAETEQYMLTLLHGGLEYVRTRAASSGRNVTHHHGESDHLAWLERPFREAIHALQTRPHHHT